MHSINDLYFRTTKSQGFSADFNAMLEWLKNWDMEPCTSVYFGEEVNIILVTNWICYRNSLSNLSNTYERIHLVECALDSCEDELERDELQDRISQLTDGHLMAIAGIGPVETSEIATVDCAASRSIQIEWHIEDVQNIRADLTDEQAAHVLQVADRRHDAEIGINCDVLRFHAGELYPLPDGLESDEDE